MSFPNSSLQFCGSFCGFVGVYLFVVFVRGCDGVLFVGFCVLWGGFVCSCWFFVWVCCFVLFSPPVSVDLYCMKSGILNTEWIE